MCQALCSFLESSEYPVKVLVFIPISQKRSLRPRDKPQTLWVDLTSVTGTDPGRTSCRSQGPRVNPAKVHAGGTWVLPLLCDS